MSYLALCDTSGLIDYYTPDGDVEPSACLGCDACSARPRRDLPGDPFTTADAAEVAPW